MACDRRNAPLTFIARRTRSAPAGPACCTSCIRILYTKARMCVSHTNEQRNGRVHSVLVNTSYNKARGTRYVVYGVVARARRPISTRQYYIIAARSRSITSLLRARQRAHHLLHTFRYLQAATCRAHRWIFTYSLYSPRVLLNVISGSLDRRPGAWDPLLESARASKFAFAVIR